MTTAIGKMLTVLRPKREYPDGLQVGGPMTDLLALFPGLGAQVVAGVRVDHNVSLTLSAVYRAVWIIAMTIATQPRSHAACSGWRMESGFWLERSRAIASSVSARIPRCPRPSSGPPFWGTRC